MNQEAFVELCRVYLVDHRKLTMSAALKLCVCVCFNDLRDFRMMGTQVLVFKLKFENFVYHKIKIFTGGAYAPYAPCMGTPLRVVYQLFSTNDSALHKNIEGVSFNLEML